MSDSSPNASSASTVPSYVPGEPVALFIPCYVDQFYPQVGEATARLLARLGVPTVFPDRQTCCGQPAFNSGYWEEAAKVIHHFCKAMAGHRWIVSPSGSCSAMCRVFFGHVDPAPEVVDVGRRVFELTEFLVNVLGVTDTGIAFLTRWRCTMAAIPGENWAWSIRRCGSWRRSAGWSTTRSRTSKSAADSAARSASRCPACRWRWAAARWRTSSRAGAEVVVSPDISCLMHIGGILRRNAATRHVRTMHIAEVLVADCT